MNRLSNDNSNTSRASKLLLPLKLSPKFENRVRVIVTIIYMNSGMGIKPIPDQHKALYIVERIVLSCSADQHLLSFTAIVAQEPYGSFLCATCWLGRWRSNASRLGSIVRVANCTLLSRKQPQKLALDSQLQLTLWLSDSAHVIQASPHECEVGVSVLACCPTTMRLGSLPPASGCCNPWHDHLFIGLGRDQKSSWKIRN
eukprot:1113184-Amphidinium_carterae.1